MDEERTAEKASQVTRYTASRPTTKKNKTGRTRTKSQSRAKEKQELGNEKRTRRKRKRGRSSKKPETSENETITRQFGITPARTCPQCRSLGEQISEKGKRAWRCPRCQQVITPRPPCLPQDSFIRFQKLVNVLIKRGRDLPLKYFRETGTTAPKTFYNRIRTDPQVQKIAKQARLHNRLQRCAAQYAYFSIQEYKRRQLTVR